MRHRPILAAVLLAAVPAIFAAPSALAHAILLASTPAAGATVPAGATELEFRFNSRIDKGRSALRLTRPDRTQATLSIAEGGEPDALRTRADLTPGKYVLRWQVLAIDGHVTRGDVPFQVAPKP